VRLSAVVSPPVSQGAIRNVERIRSLPFLLAGLVAVLAAASLAHAVLSTVRRSHRQLAIWKSLGFTRHQARAAAAYHATILAIAAVAIGAPLGIMLGRVGWNAVAEQIGVASPPVTSIVGIGAAILGAVTAANLIAAYPAWRVARQPTAIALRVDKRRASDSRRISTSAAAR
jgi:putative ABC transport system permease protein